jgi:hypothetical protein
MSIAGSLLVATALVVHVTALIALILGARWLGRQRRLGYPDDRARILDRRAIRWTFVAAWLWLNVAILTQVAIIAARL